MRVQMRTSRPLFVSPVISAYFPAFVLWGVSRYVALIPQIMFTLSVVTPQFNQGIYADVGATSKLM